MDILPWIFSSLHVKTLMCVGLHALMQPLDDPDGLFCQTFYKLYKFRSFRGFRFGAKVFSRPNTLFLEKLSVHRGRKDAVDHSWCFILVPSQAMGT